MKNKNYSQLIENYKFNIGDKVKICTSLMNPEQIKKLKLETTLDLTGTVISECNVFRNIWEHEVDFGCKIKTITSSFLKYER